MPRHISGTSSQKSANMDYLHGGIKKSGLSTNGIGRKSLPRIRMATNLQGESVREGRMKDLRKQKAELIKTLNAQMKSFHQAVGQLNEAIVAESFEPPGETAGQSYLQHKEAVDEAQRQVASTQKAINLVNAKINANQK